MSIYNHIWSYMITNAHIWSYIIIYDNIWSYMIMYDQTWSYMIHYLKVGFLELLSAEGAHKYLGRAFCGDLRKRGLRAVEHRLSCGWGKFRSLMPTLTNRHISTALRLKLFEAVVSPTVLYSLETVALTDALAKRLDTVQRCMLRLSAGFATETTHMKNAVAGCNGDSLKHWQPILLKIGRCNYSSEGMTWKIEWETLPCGQGWHTTGVQPAVQTWTVMRHGGMLGDPQHAGRKWYLYICILYICWGDASQSKIGLLMQASFSRRAPFTGAKLTARSVCYYLNIHIWLYITWYMLM